MALDEDAIRVQVGACFMEATEEEGEEFVKMRTKEYKAQIKEKQNELNKVISELSQLRAKLKTKFGDHIGLPEVKPSKHAGRQKRWIIIIVSYYPMLLTSDNQRSELFFPFLLVTLLINSNTYNLQM